MAKTFSFLMKAHILDEYYDEGPTHATINFTPAYIKRILHLSRVVTKSKASYIADYDNSPNWHTLDPSDPLSEEISSSGSVYIENYKELPEWEEDTMDSVYISVYNDMVSWKGYIKHSNIQMETESLNISDLKQYQEVMLCPIKKLPLLIGTLSENANKYLMARIGMEEK
jgi:hypothetical protein